MAESARVLDGLAARVERLVDPPEAPQKERAVGNRGCFRVVQIDQRGLSILDRVIERLPLVEVVERRRELATEEMRHPERVMSLAFTLVNAAWLRLLRRMPLARGEQADAVIAYTTEQGVPFWMPHGLVLRGWALAEQGELQQGIADLEQGLAAMTEMGTDLGRSAHYANLATATARAGRFAEARALIERSKALVVATGERYYESEIYRLDAELVVSEAGGADGAPSDARASAEALLHTAIECASRQGARTLELRATTALARVCGRGAKGRQTRARLADLLASFTEGFDTTDLQEARRLAAEGPRSPTSARSRKKGS